MCLVYDSNFLSFFLFGRFFLLLFFISKFLMCFTYFICVHISELSLFCYWLTMTAQRYPLWTSQFVKRKVCRWLCRVKPKHRITILYMFWRALSFFWIPLEKWSTSMEYKRSLKLSKAPLIHKCDTVFWRKMSLTLFDNRFCYFVRSPNLLLLLFLEFIL